MLTTRAGTAVLWLSAIGLGSAAAWGAQPKVREAILYVSAPAEVVASVTPAGPKASFDLPKLLVPDSVHASQGANTIPAVLKPIYAPARDRRPPEVLRYEMRVPGAKVGAAVQLSFRTGGLAWTPAMSLQFASPAARLQVQASITNQALDLTGARLRLMGGYVGRRGDSISRVTGLSDYDWYGEILQEYGRAADTQARGALHTVTELPAADLPVGSTRQAPLFSADVVASRSYRWDTRPRSDGDTSPRPERALAIYSFDNTTTHALPEGTVTVSEGGVPVGEGYLARTPPGETAAIVVGNVRGLTVQRKEEEAPKPATWETEHSISLQVESTREEPVRLRVVEHLRSQWDEWGDWGDEDKPIYEFSVQPEVGKEDVFAWDLPVPARGRTEVSYSYAEPIDNAPLRLIEIVPDDSPRERRYIVEVDRAAVQWVRDNDQRIRRIQPEGDIIYRLPVPPNVTRADLMVGGANTLRISLAPQVEGKPGAFTVVADLEAIAGRRVNDASNYNTFWFDLTPFLGEERVAYVRLDNPAGGEAFFAWVEAYRVPEGFPSRGREYARGDAASAPKTVIFAFAPGTPAEGPHVYLDRDTGPNGDVRVADLDHKLIYSFTIPADAPGAYLTLHAWNTPVVAAARDAGGAPGDFHEELNIRSLLGRKVYDGRNMRDYAVDLTPYLANNPSRTVYVAIYAGDQTTGWGAAWNYVEVAQLDEVGRARLARLQRQMDADAKEDRARHLLDIRANSNETEGPYLYENRGSELKPWARSVNGNAEVIYRLPVKTEWRGARVEAWVIGDYAVSYASDDHGHPGPFTEVKSAREKDDQRSIEAYLNMTCVSIDITPTMAESGAVYVRIRDGAPGTVGDGQLHNLGIVRP
jgi:hypothetical protein